MEIQQVLSKQNAFFTTHKTKDINFRKLNLKKLKALILENETHFYEAIYKDFGKSKFDTFTTELSFVINEINYFLRHLSSLSKPKSVKTNLANLPASSIIYKEPYGTILVIGAWNYPIQLSLLPVVSALAAGNTVVLKPSELAANTSKLLADIINKDFGCEYLHVIEGDVEITTKILEQKFDKIFFTGSSRVGKIVYEAAAKHLTPVTLELGGKSPVIVTKTADIKIAAKRIVWGKFLNAGQTCVAPDYVLVDDNVKTELLSEIKYQLDNKQYQSESSHYTQIINNRNFDRLKNLIDHNKIFYGGETNTKTRFIQPTILTNIDWEDQIMQEEIFGPILPILSYKTLDEAFNNIQKLEKPLAAYLFSTNSNEKKQFLNKISFGGGCINDVIMHLSNDALPFGGVGNSGIGNYHGKYSFDNFSHSKAVLKKANWGEPNIKYPPYTEQKLNIIKKIL